MTLPSSQSQTESGRDVYKRQGLLDGTIDMIVTDHAPHSREEKARGLENSAMGVVGLETSFAACYTSFVKPGVLPLGKLMDLMHDAPCLLYTSSHRHGSCGRAGASADRRGNAGQ